MTMNYLFVDDKEGSPSAFTSSSVTARSSASTTAMATRRCSSTPRLETFVRPSGCPSTTPTPDASSLTMDTRLASGRLVTALAAAAGQGWIVADQKNDWTRVFKN